MINEKTEPNELEIEVKNSDTSFEIFWIEAIEKDSGSYLIDGYNEEKLAKYDWNKTGTDPKVTVLKADELWTGTTEVLLDGKAVTMTATRPLFPKHKAASTAKRWKIGESI